MRKKIVLRFAIAFLSFLLLQNCSHQEPSKGQVKEETFAKRLAAKANYRDSLVCPPNKNQSTNANMFFKIIQQLPDSAFVNVMKLDSSFILDIRYATTNNFVGTKLYDCQQCWLRKVVALALVEAQRTLLDSGYRLVLYDCYRPHSVQWELWNKVPDPTFVAHPAKGSMHNRGVAVDVGLADLAGNVLDMGSPYDSFSKASYHAYTDLPEEVLRRRMLLKEVMQKHQLKFTTSEWWHYSYQQKFFTVSNFKWNCSTEEMLMQ